MNSKPVQCGMEKEAMLCLETINRQGWGQSLRIFPDNLLFTCRRDQPIPFVQAFYFAYLVLGLVHTAGAWGRGKENCGYRAGIAIKKNDIGPKAAAFAMDDSRQDSGKQYCKMMAGSMNLPSSGRSSFSLTKRSGSFSFSMVGCCICEAQSHGEGV